MAYFPFMIELDNKNCVIGGGGAVAVRKVETMLAFGAKVTVVAPEIDDAILQMADEKLVIKKHSILEEDLVGADIAIMATNDETVNSRMAAFCRGHNILVNVVDVKEECDFYFPAIIKQDDVVIAVSTGGDSPLLAARIKKDIQKNLGGCYGRLANLLGNVRDKVLEAVKTPAKRKQVFHELIEKGIQQDGVVTQEQVDETIERYVDSVIRIGTRGSALALVQTDMVIERLKQSFSDFSFEKVILSTKGDRQTERPLLEFGGKAVFVEEFEEAIRNGEMDMAVHSAKDMPTELLEGLTISGVLPRADVRDVLICKKDNEFARCLMEELQSTQAKNKSYNKYIVGTSSLRRQYQIKEVCPGIQCSALRGNVNTRLDKLRREEYDAIILAAAGVKRMGLDKEPDLLYRYLSDEEMLPAACQGIIAIETADKGFAQDMAAQISDQVAMLQFMTERRVLKLLNAGCHEPVGVYAKCKDEKMHLTLMQVKDGKVCRNTVCGNDSEWEELAEQVVKKSMIFEA